MSRAVLVGLMIIGVGGWVPSALAESRPLKQLPTDVVKWSTMWVEVPRQMVEVGKDEGPLAALTWGPAKGTAMMIQSTTKELWDAVKPDQRPRHQSGTSQPVGAILRYEF